MKGLCADDDGQTIIIENQLEKTDHNHLGQVLTYLINMDSKAAIWIAKETRQEHINVINWLNEVSDKGFYLVKVEAYKIDNSDPAPFFSIICKPTDESRKLGLDKKELQENIQSRRLRKSLADTIIVPARKDGFEKVFLGEDSWYSIRLKADKIPDLKYIAVYQVAPISAITHVAKIKEIITSDEDTSKYKVIFEDKAEEIRNIPLGRKSKIQSPVYGQYEKLQNCKNVDELLATDEIKKAA